MNPISKLISWHINFLTPKLFGSLLGGLFGGDRPDAPSLESMIAKGNNTNGLLFNTGYSFNPNSKVGTGNVSLTGTGQGIANDYSRLFEDAQQNYNSFDIPQYADDRYGLMRDIMNRDDVMGMNRLMATQNAQGGGVGVTSGQRDTSARFGAEQGFNRQKAILGLLNQGENRENTLFGRVEPALSNYANFMSGGGVQLNNDMMQYNNMSKQVGSQRQGQYESDTQDWADDMAFWNDIGGTIDAGITGGFSNYMNTGSIFGNMGGGGQAGLSASGNAFSGISGYNAASPFAQAYPGSSQGGGFWNDFGNRFGSMLDIGRD